MTMNRFAYLLHGSTEEALQILGEQSLDVDDLRAALCNAFTRIQQLEKDLDGGDDE